MATQALLLLLFAGTAVEVLRNRLAGAGHAGWRVAAESQAGRLLGWRRQLALAGLSWALEGRRLELRQRQRRRRRWGRRGRRRRRPAGFEAARRFAGLRAALADGPAKAAGRGRASLRLGAFAGRADCCCVWG